MEYATPCMSMLQQLASLLGGERCSKITYTRQARLAPSATPCHPRPSPPHRQARMHDQAPGWELLLSQLSPKSIAQQRSNRIHRILLQEKHPCPSVCAGL
eukprot:1150293-Pelagomonas_calceolata.AAC.4